MSEVRPPYDDEVDLFELFETLWDSKWLISAFVAAAVFLGGGFLLTKDPAYESRLVYSIDSQPPFYDSNKVLSDFQKMFYSQNVFEDWKRENASSTIVFDDFSETEVVDGFVVTKDKDQRLAIFTSENKIGLFILVRTNQFPLLNDFFFYANHINALLATEYVSTAKDEARNP